MPNASRDGSRGCPWGLCQMRKSLRGSTIKCLLLEACGLGGEQGKKMSVLLVVVLSAWQGRQKD
jgi:hypothetical protein